MLQGKAKEAILDDEGALKIRGTWLCVTRVDNLISIIMPEDPYIRVPTKYIKT